MHTKRFHAESLQEALQLVKKEFGSDAVILSTRYLKRPRGGLAIFGKPVVEITAALDYPVLPGASGSKGAMKPQAPPSGGVLDLAQIEKLVDPLQTEVRNLHNILQKRFAPLRRHDPKWGHDRFASDLDELKKLLKAVLERNQADPVAFLPAKIRMCYAEIVANGVDPRISMELASRVAGRYPRPLSYGHVKLLMAHEIMGSVKTAEENGDLGGGKRLIALVGPTGSGKTTTLAKMAANLAIKGGRKTVIFSIDSHRVAAAQQLKVYARIMGLPFELAPSVELLSKALLRHSDKDLILIDTPGIAPRDRKAISQLRAILGSVGDLETHLVLSATAKDSDLVDIADSFEEVPHENVIFTKLDETTSHGVILNHLRRSGKRVSFFAAGQKVSEGFEVATKERIADLVMKISEDANFAKKQGYGSGAHRVTRSL